MSLKDKLDRLNRTRTQASPAPTVAPDWVREVERTLGLNVLQQEGSFVFYRERTHPLFEQFHYRRLWERGLRIQDDGLLLGERTSREIPLPRALFLDLETTGLAGGAGTVAFLIGVAYLTLDHIVVRQYLLPDFQHEWLLLKELNNLLEGFQFTVTFNGKTFDLPLLRTRFLLNRMDSRLEEMTHLDLLHAARRVWRGRLSQCNLQTLEQEILQISREGDIPGHLIPQIFFDFIQRRQLWGLEEVLQHNYHDMVNMVLLSLHLAALAEEPARYATHPEDRWSLARYFYQNQKFERAAALLESLLNSPEGVGSQLKLQVYFLRAMIAKKQQNQALAKQYLWQILEQEHHHPRVVEELAKFYEHRDRDFHTALEIVSRGIAAIELRRQLNPDHPWLKFLPQLQHRKQRLLRKQNKQKQDAAAVHQQSEK